MNSFETKEKYLKPDSLSDRQPVQLYKERRSMVIFPGAGCYEFECFKWRVVCSLVRTQGCRKQQQGYLFHSNAIIPNETSQQHTLGF